MKKVFIFHYGNDNLQYGIAEVVTKLASLLDPNIFDVTIVYSGMLSHERHEELLGLKVIELGASSLKKCLVPLAVVVRKQKPDIVISNTEHSNIICRLATFLSYKAPKVVFIVHSPISLRLELMWATREAALIRFLIKIFYKPPVKIVGVSDFVSKDLKSICPMSNVTTIYNPISINSGQVQTKEPRQGKALLVAGRLVKNKNVHEAIKLISLLNDDSVLEVVGDGPELENLQNYASKLKVSTKVKFYLFQSSLAPFYERADVLISSSKWEGFGNVLVEAMSYGVQVIVNKNSGAPMEIIGDGEFGFSYDGGSAESLLECYNKMLVEPVDPSNLMNRAQNFSDRKSIQGYAKLLSNL